MAEALAAAARVRRCEIHTHWGHIGPHWAARHSVPRSVVRIERHGRGWYTLSHDAPDTEPLTSSPTALVAFPSTPAWGVGLLATRRQVHSHAACCATAHGPPHACAGWPLAARRSPGASALVEHLHCLAAWLHGSHRRLARCRAALQLSRSDRGLGARKRPAISSGARGMTCKARGGGDAGGGASVRSCRAPAHGQRAAWPRADEQQGLSSADPCGHTQTSFTNPDPSLVTPGAP